MPFQRVHFLLVNVLKITKHRFASPLFSFHIALELFPSSQDAAKGAENINNRGLAIFHFTNGF
jgi:hypothetical protein